MLLQKKRLVELLRQIRGDEIALMDEEAEILIDHLLENGVIVPHCKVGDVVYYVSDSPMSLSVQANTIYEAHVTRIITTKYGTTLVIQIHNSYGVTEIPDVNDWGVTVFATWEEAEQKLRKDEGK